MKRTPVELFWAKVNKTDTCWLWTAHLNHGGYGHFRADTRTYRAHRFAYENLVGPIPHDLEIDRAALKEAVLKNGEIIPGVEVVEGQVKYSVAPN